MSGVPRAAVLVLALALPACAPPGAPEPIGAEEPPLTARGVTVRLPVDGGELVARSREATFDPGGESLSMTGDASVTLDGDAFFEAEAERITIDAGGGAALLEGRVRARLVLAARDDANGGDDG